MINILKNIEVYSPEYLGKKDIVIEGDKFQGIYDNINIPKDFIKINIIDCNNKIMFPGFIDCHVHIIGGGGEGGFTTRTPEIKVEDLTTAGITTVVGCLGTDNISRGANNLIAKVKQLNQYGITAVCYTGSYQVPVETLTGNIKRDIMFVNEIIGVGEIALSDHRSSQPSYEEFAYLVAEARVGGLLSNKSGIVNVHLGVGKRRLEYLLRLIEETEIPITQVLPTHINRSTDLFNEGLKYVNRGGIIDFTTSSDENFPEEGEIFAHQALKIAYDKKIPIENITFSSDGNGSMQKFNKDGSEAGLGICSVKTLYEQVKKAIKEDNVPIEEALKVITSNPARVLKLNGKGKIEKDYDADFVLVDKESLNITDVYAFGKPLVVEGKEIVRDVFS